MGYREGLGLVLIALACIAFLIHLVQVRRGSKPRRMLVEEAIHDLGLFCLGLSGILAEHVLVRDVLFGAALVALAVYLVRKYGNKGQQVEDSALS